MLIFRCMEKMWIVFSSYSAHKGTDEIRIIVVRAERRWYSPLCPELASCGGSWWRIRCCARSCPRNRRCSLWTILPTSWKSQSYPRKQQNAAFWRNLLDLHPQCLCGYENDRKSTEIKCSQFLFRFPVENETIFSLSIGANLGRVMAEPDMNITSLQ